MGRIREDVEGQPIATFAFQGEEAAFSELAGTLCWPGVASRGCRTFADVVGMVEARDDTGGILPIANRIVGRIDEGIAALREARRIDVVATLDLPVQLHLAAPTGVPVGSIRRVLGHPVALAQCRQVLERLVGVELMPHFDSAAAAREVGQGGWADTAVVVGEAAVRRYGLVILDRDIQDRSDNATRFIAIRRKL